MSLFWRVRPVSSDGSFLLGPSITASSTRPMRAWCRCRADRSTTTRRRSKRSAATSGSTKRSDSAAASVPGRGENTKVYALSYSASETTSRVRSKSSSVSPGNPTMMSVVTARSDTAVRAFLSFSR